MHKIKKPIPYKLIKYGKLVRRQSKDFFNVIEFIIDPINDIESKNFVEFCRKKALSMKTNCKNTDSKIRTTKILLKDKYIGVASEYLLTLCINKYFIKNAINKTAVNPEFTDYNSHIDIIILDNSTQTSKTIELRSSFPYASLDQVIWHYFDLIGPYTTSYKNYESSKDFYARALINPNKKNFNFNRKHSIFLTGGAPFSLFEDYGSYITMGTSANYTVIEPLADSYDIIDFIKML